jgi:hypothetical protein
VAYIFFSYSWKELETAERLVRKLEAQGHRVWFDKQEIKGGENWLKELETGLQAVDLVMLLLSPASAASEWVRDELTFARNLRKTVIPYMIETAGMPFVLQTIQPINATEDEKIAFEQLVSAIENAMRAKLAESKEENGAEPKAENVVPPKVAESKKEKSAERKTVEWVAILVTIIGIIVTLVTSFIGLCANGNYWWCPAPNPPSPIIQAATTEPAIASPIPDTTTTVASLPSDTPGGITPSSFPLTSPSESPSSSPEPSETLIPDLRIYASSNYFTVHLLEVGQLDLRPLEFVSVINGQNIERSFGAFFTELAATSGMGQANTCYVLRLDTGGIPSSCEEAPHIITISGADYFWLDSSSDELLTVAIHYGESMVQCNSSQLRFGCDVDIP